MTVTGLGAAVDGDDDGALRLRVAAEEDVAVARRDEPLVRPAPERGVGLADRDELHVVGAERLVPWEALAGEDVLLSPRHVAPVVGPVAARRRATSSP